jgi:hypothetical protein
MKNWEFNKLGIENYNNPQNRMFKYYEFIKNNYNKIEGDIHEFGVFQGKSLFSTALLLKELNSNKKIYAFDSYCGLSKFENNEKDNLENFKLMFEKNIISKKHYEDVLKLQKYNDFYNKKNNSMNVSSSNDFSNTSLESLKKKAEYLNLDNIIFVQGSFEDTIKKFMNTSIFCSNIDCDLYNSYEICLPFVYENLEKGGFIHLDEYYSLKFPGARLYCDEYFEKNNIIPTKHINEYDEWERWYVIKK